MEPMTLGSAPSSPASPGVNPNFLPNFLMGDTQQATSPNQGSTSPGRNRNSGNFSKFGALGSNESKNLRSKLFNQSLNESNTQSPFTAMSEKAGPPKCGLFDSLERKPAAGTPIMSSTVAYYNEPAPFNESISRIHEDSLNCSVNLSDSQRNLNRFERIDTLWVTIFGFPPSALNLVLSELSNCGHICDKKVPSQGNWVHVKFNNISEVARVLQLNGKCINNSIMIGVKLYYNGKQDKENDTSLQYTSPIRARSLRHSFISPTNSNSVLPPQTLPQKSTGIVTKAMEYVFGW